MTQTFWINDAKRGMMKKPNGTRERVHAFVRSSRRKERKEMEIKKNGKLKAKTKIRRERKKRRRRTKRKN